MAMKIHVVVCWVVTLCSDVVGTIFTLKMGAARFFTMLVFYHITTWCYNTRWPLELLK